MNDTGQGAATGAAPPFPHTSDMLLALLTANPAETLTLGDLTKGLMNRVLGFIMMIFAIPCIVPVPPGIPFLCGLVILLCGVHLLIGRETLLLPGVIARRQISRAVLQRIVSRAVPVAKRLERLCRPRWPLLTSRAGRALLGCVVVMLALILLLPIPFLGNMPPGIAVAILALGFIERDGVVISVGFVTSIAAVVVVSAMGWATIRGLGWLV